MFMPRSFSHACKDYWIYDLESHFYIREDGTLRNCYPKHFKTEQEAQDFLNKWLPKGHWIEWLDYLFGKVTTTDYTIDWLTQEHIQEQAELGDKEALDCSIEHWKQIVVAGWDVFYTAYRRGKVNIYSNYCALCERFKLPSPYIGTKCSNCTIATKAGVSGCLDTPHEKARIAFDRRDKQAFKSAAVEELNFLIELRNELFGNPYSTIKLETEKMSDKMIEIKGKKISEDTIVEALLKFFGPDKPKQYAVEVRKYHGRPRVVIRLPYWAIKKIREDDISSFVFDPEMLEDTANWSLDRNEDYTKDDYLSEQIEFSIGEIKG